MFIPDYVLVCGCMVMWAGGRAVTAICMRWGGPLVCVYRYAVTILLPDLPRNSTYTILL